MSNDTLNRCVHVLRGVGALAPARAIFVIVCAAALYAKCRIDALRRTLVAERRHWSHRALHDALTGLPNPALPDDRLDHTIFAAKRGHTPMALLLLDLDCFKHFNRHPGTP